MSSIVYIKQTNLSVSYLMDNYGKKCTNYYAKLSIWATPYLEVNIIEKTWTRIVEREVTLMSLDELISIHKSIDREKIIDNILN